MEPPPGGGRVLPGTAYGIVAPRAEATRAGPEGDAFFVSEVPFR